MLVVGIETSGLSGSVALIRDGHVLEQRSLQQAGRRHAQSLVLELKQLLSEHQVRPDQISAVAVSRGPGSFTGLRVGIVCAKTFAYAAGCRFAAIDTFLAIAENCPTDVHDVWVVEDAQRGDLFAARYHRSAQTEWTQSEAIAIVPGEEWLQKMPPDAVVTGRGLTRHDLTNVPATCLTSESIACPSAVKIALVGERFLARQDIDADDSNFDLWKAVPFYIRPSAAEEKRDKLQASQATNP